MVMYIDAFGGDSSGTLYTVEYIHTCEWGLFNINVIQESCTETENHDFPRPWQ